MDQQETLGFAKVVRRRTATFPSRMASYFDFTPWRGGYMRVTSAPGGVVLAPGICADIRSGRVYRDARF